MTGTPAWDEVAFYDDDDDGHWRHRVGRDYFLVSRYEARPAPPPTMAPDVPPEALQPSGHHPDGSSIQQHSAGGLYPCVLVWRDKKGTRRYDVGVIIPGHEPIWCRDLDAAVALGEAWLKGRAA